VEKGEGGVSDARAGENVGENGDGGGGECRACVGLNGGPGLGKVDEALESGEKGEVGGGPKDDGAVSLSLSDDPSPSPFVLCPSAEVERNRLIWLSVRQGRVDGVMRHVVSCQAAQALSFLIFSSTSHVTFGRDRILVEAEFHEVERFRTANGKEISRFNQKSSGPPYGVKFRY
jgi:hypothetical protein